MAFDPSSKQAAQARFKAQAEGRRSILAPCTEKGILLGENHHRAKLTDAQVEAIRTAYEALAKGWAEGKPKRGMRDLAKAYGVSRATIEAIVYYRRRSAWPERWKRIDK